MINIAEILKDCPKGMELDSPNYNGVVKFEGVTQSNLYPIKISITHNNMIFTNTLTKYGQTYKSQYHKCVIFPKGKTTWEGFQKPFKDGDVVVSKSGCWIGIVKSYNDCDETYNVYVAFENWAGNYINIFVDIKLEMYRLATEEEKEKFFKAIEDNGYQWDPETKTLYKPEFKDGDVVINDRGNIFIYKGLLYNDKNRVDFYCGYLTNEHAFVIKESKDSNFGSIDSLRLATEEEKQILFDAIEREKLFYAMEKEKQFYAIKDNGYQGDSKTKTLSKLVNPKFKDGDVCTGKVRDNLVIFIYKNRINTTLVKSHFTLYVRVGVCKNCCITLKDEEIKFATEEEKQELFKAIQDNGYRLDLIQNTLRVVGKLGKLKFKVGDVVQDKECNKVKITEVVHECGCYLYKTEIANEIGKIYFDEENDWELAPNKFDITALKPFDKVLVRQDYELKWVADFFGFQKEGYYYTTGNHVYVQCIPYEENKHLLGTTNDCDDFYKNW